jgi:hypothetical protein
MSEIVLTTREAVHGCGIGRGARCCRFLLQEVEGDHRFLCGRGGEFHQRLVNSNQFVAARMPTEPYPECQLKGSR